MNLGLGSWEEGEVGGWVDRWVVVLCVVVGGELEKGIKRIRRSDALVQVYTGRVAFLSNKSTAGLSTPREESIPIAKELNSSWSYNLKGSNPLIGLQACNGRI